MADPFEREDEEELVEICDSDGKRAAMRHLATIGMGDRVYHVLGALDEEDEHGFLLIREERTSDGAQEYIVTNDEREIEHVIGRFIMESIMHVISEAMEADEWEDGISPCGMKHRPGEFCVCGQPDYLQ